MKWDDGVASNIEIFRPNKHIQVVHVVNKAALNFKNRDFIDKRLFFKHEGAYYIYISACPDEVSNYLKTLT